MPDRVTDKAAVAALFMRQAEEAKPLWLRLHKSATIPPWKSRNPAAAAANRARITSKSVYWAGRRGKQDADEFKVIHAEEGKSGLGPMLAIFERPEGPGQ